MFDKFQIIDNLDLKNQLFDVNIMIILFNSWD